MEFCFEVLVAAVMSSHDDCLFITFTPVDVVRTQSVLFVSSLSATVVSLGRSVGRLLDVL